MPGKPKPAGGEGGGSHKREPSKRASRSRARAAAHNELEEKARRLRAVFFIRRWARLASPPPPALLQQAAPAPAPMQLLPQPPREAVPPSTKRACSATATPKAATESGEEKGSMECLPAPSATAARVHGGAQRARMHSPIGGPAAGQLHGPAASAGGCAPQPVPASAGQPTQHTYSNAAQSMLAHLRTVEYPRVTQELMQQGMSQQEAHARYMQYEQYRMSGGR